MPTPLAHGVAGYAAARTFRNEDRGWVLVLVAFFVVILPDLDFIPGLLIGDPGKYHRHGTHSLVGSVLFSIPVAAGLSWLSARRSNRGPAAHGSARSGFAASFVLVWSIYLSHLVLDLLSPDLVNNAGLLLWWPFSYEYAILPLPLPATVQSFFDLQFGPDRAGFFRTLFSGHAMAVLFAEAVLFSPVLLVPWLVRLFRRARSGLAERATPRLEAGSEI